MTEFQYLDEGNSEAQDRLATSFLLAQTSVGLARTGVLAGLTVAQTTTASGAVLVAAGAAPVQASVGTGVALLVNDTTKTLDVFTAHPMGGLPRNDVVAFDSVTKAIIAIIGTPNATPDDPTVPATACALARLRHAASATTIPTAKIDDLRVLIGNPHAEFTTTANGLSDATLYTAGTVAIDATKSTDTTFAVGSTSGYVTLGAGIYAIQWLEAVGAATTGRTFLSINPGTEVARSSCGIGEDTASVSVPNLRLTTSTNVILNVLKNVGGTSNAVGRVRVTKISG